VQHSAAEHQGLDDEGLHRDLRRDLPRISTAINTPSTTSSTRQRKPPIL
jgi:hypothetical protein